MRPLTLKLLGMLRHDRFVSGALLARQFGVTRATVSEALHEAQALGVDVFAVTRRGYRLAAPLELIDVAIIREALGAAKKRVDVEVVEVIDSTNAALIARAAQGIPSGHCLVAELQTAGRGRMGRRWQSALGGSLTFSLLWRFDKGAAQLGGLSLAAGLAVAEALNRRLGTPRVRVKWPNDLVVDGRKLGGILIESAGELLGPTAAVIGIGINLALAESVAADIDQPFIDWRELAGEDAPRNVLLAEILAQLVADLDRFQAQGFAAFTERWAALSALQGREVLVHIGAERLAATVVGVAADGALQVQCAGALRTIASGEVSVRMAPDRRAP